MQPARPSVRRGLPARPGQPPAVKQDQRVREFLFGGNEILDIDLLDQEFAVGVVFVAQLRRVIDEARLPSRHGHHPAARP